METMAPSPYDKKLLTGMSLNHKTNKRPTKLNLHEKYTYIPKYLDTEIRLDR